MKRTNGFFKIGFAIALALVSRSGLAAPSPICQMRQSALRFVLDSQVRADGSIYRRGDWGSRVKLGGFAQQLGLLKDGTYEDENLFTTASIHNILAEIYLLYGHDARLLAPMADATRTFGRYQTQRGAYDFWPKVPGSRPEIFVPRFQLTSDIVQGLLLIPADADDTSVTQLAHVEDRLICEQRFGKASPGCPSPTTGVAGYFTPYRDNIRLPAPSNLAQGDLLTGAYMTWLQTESPIPDFVHALGPAFLGPRIVLDKNDVDCVVNANVLRTLTITDETGAPGYAAACRFLNAAARDLDFNSCGDYYPDTYWYHYAVARAYQDGATCLREGAELALESIMNTQRPDGSWHNQVLSDGDVLSTAFALGALVKAGNPRDPRQVAAVRAGLNYLRSQMRVDPDGRGYWSGGVFFSAGVPARTDVLWHSDAFTTSVVTLFLYDLKNWLPEAASCR